MLTDKEYAGYKTNKLIELKEKDSIDAYESTCKNIKELKGKYKEYVDILLCLCNWLTDNSKYEKSYADWVTTDAGVNLIPRSIVFDNKNDKIVMDVELFQGIVMEGIISEQAKEIKKAMINIKQILKNNLLDKIVNIKPAVNYWDDHDTVPGKRGAKDIASNSYFKSEYYSKKVIVGRITINKYKLTNAIAGFFKLLGTNNHIFDNVNNNLDQSLIYVCKVKSR